MPIYRPTELIQLLTSLGIAPRKGLSQNFLIDGNIIRKIVAAAKVERGDLILEVGPGPGALTESLLDAGATVIAVEKDPILAKSLEERLKAPGRDLHVFCDDILTFPFEKELKSYRKKAKFIANLPYHLTTPITTQFISRRDLFSMIMIMIQDEVAVRFTSKPGNKDYGSITLFLNYYSNPQYLFKVSAKCFFPVPKVESAVVALNLKEPPHVSSEEGFFEMTRTAFKQRRKMLRGSLRELYGSDRVVECLKHLQLPENVRPEQLSLEEFIRLFELIKKA